MEISEGMYVRTKYGIKKIESIVCGQDIKLDNTIGFDESLKKHHDYDGISIYDNYFWNNEIIRKPSYNIIDLIEVGDYVNGHKVYDEFRLDTDDYGINFIEIGIESDKFLNHYIKKEDIKSIVTKEQMESMVYEVEK